MTSEQETLNEKMQQQAIINEYKDLLSQKDYMARKVIFELAEKFHEAFPTVALPEYTKYCEIEAQAKEYRTIIAQAEAQLSA